FPQRAAEAARLLHVRLALLEIVAVGEQVLDAVLEQPLLLAELEVHRPPHSSFRKSSEARLSGIHERRSCKLCSAYVHGFRARAFGAPRNDTAPVYHNPSIPLAMMFFWISLVPP